MIGGGTGGGDIVLDGDICSVGMTGNDTGGTGRGVKRSWAAGAESWSTGSAGKTLGGGVVSSGICVTSGCLISVSMFAATSARGCGRSASYGVLAITC